MQAYRQPVSASMEAQNVSSEDGRSDYQYYCMVKAHEASSWRWMHYWLDKMERI